MSSEEFSDKLEELIVGIIQFILRFLRSLRDLLFRPSKLIEAVHSDFSEARYLAPHGFLLSAALALGFFGRILAEGFGQISFATIERLRDINMWSFLNQSVPVFAIAIITAVLAQALFRGQDEARIRRFKQLNYYVIGFFGIGSIAVLLLLSGFLRLVFTGLRYDGADLFTLVSLVTFGGYVLAMLVLLYRLTSAAFRGDPGTGWSKTIKLRVLLCNLVVIALCVFNFVSPLYQRDEGAPPLQGRLVDIHESPDEGLRITFLIKNVSTTDVVLNLLDDVTVAAENTEGSRQEETDRICSSRKPGASLPGFTLLAAQKSTLLEFCTGNQRLLGLIKEAGYVEIARSQGGMRLKNTSKQKLQFSARLRVVIGNRRGGDLEVPLT